MEKICLCKNVNKDTIITAVSKGTDTYEKMMRETGAGTGACKGARCKCKINEIINENK